MTVRGEPEVRESHRRDESERRRGGTRNAARGRYWRFLAWAVAIPAGFVTTALPAYWFGLIRSNDLLNIVLSSGLGRYGRLGGLVVIWAFVTALLVHLLFVSARDPTD